MLGEARIGTSGFAYKEWVGHVYPSGASPGQMLPLYAERLAAVELVAGLSRAPGAELLESWAASVPPGFEFAVKAPPRVGVELSSGKNAIRAMGAFLEVAEHLGDALGPVLIQVPGTHKPDRHALAALLDALPEGLRVAFDFRHRSWLDDATLRLLSAHEAALALTDDGEGAPRLELTANFTYVRIRRDDDDLEAIDRWAERLALLTRRGVDVHAFVKHDRKGFAVDRAMRLASLLRTESSVGEQAMLS
jgi:uncharacterized protein YecE (DUF72 family)